MDVEHRAIVEYWASRRDESRLSVDWGDAERLCWRCAQEWRLQRCHIVPRSLGGADTASNLVLLCGQCHAEAPNVADSEFMWAWRIAHAASFYGGYWLNRGLREFEFAFGRPAFQGVGECREAFALASKALEAHMRRTGMHWGQGKINPATIAWLFRQVEIELANNAQQRAAGDAVEPRA